MEKTLVPFYTLKEAVKLINEKNKTNCYSVKKILALALIYDLKLYVYAYGWNLSCEFSYEIKDYFKYTRENIENFHKTINDYLHMVSFSKVYHGGLLELGPSLISKIQFKKILKLTFLTIIFQII